MAWIDNFISGDDFDSIRLGVASREDILSWSYGEVTRPETINYRTQKPERDGLFCERIFGPVKDINPHDSKLKGVRSREAAIDKEGNLVTKAISRRERMGHIELASPVAHIWFMRGVPSALSLLLDMPVKAIEKVVYFSSYIIISAETDKIAQILADAEATLDAAKQAITIRYENAAKDENANVKALAEAQAKELQDVEDEFAAKKMVLTGLVKGAIISEVDYRNLDDEYEELIEVGMGAGTIQKLLNEIDLSKLIEDLRTEVESSKGLKAKKLIKRLKTLEGMSNSGVKPSDLILTVIPVIPPDLRPMISLSGGRFATSDLNDLYRRIINRNNRLKKLMSLNAPEVICRNEMRMLQEAVDALIDGSAARKSNGRAAATGSRRPLKSLSDGLKGKQGRFRQNLLGKRVDYSGRSVIVIGPELRLNECGMPKIIALELFKPFVISWLISHENATNIKSATRLIDDKNPIIWDALDEVIVDKYVLLNRAPSLHRLSIQAFKPKLIDGKAIQLHPLVLKGFNADFDGDQMAVHLPLSTDAQAEAREFISVRRNLLKPSDGEPILNISQDVVLGNYYLTYNKTQYADVQPIIFTSVYEAEMAYDAHKITLQTPIRVHAKKGADGEYIHNTTLGRVIFNEVLPKGYPFDNNPQTAKQIKRVMANVLEQYGAEEAVRVADAIKDLAFQYETISSISVSKDDYPTIPEVDQIIDEGDAKVAIISEQFDQGIITEDERYRLTIGVWHEADKKITDLVKDYMKATDSNMSVMVDSGARGSAKNVKLGSASIGIQMDVTNHEIELPVKSSFKSGLSTLEAFIATRGARQGQVSTALRTADSGYLTRRLVDVSQDVFTVDGDFEDAGFEVRRSEAEGIGVSFASRIAGRYASAPVDGHIGADELITKQIANEIDGDSSVESVRIQSILTTSCQFGVPRKSYGVDMSTRELVETAEPVGVIAAQSVGEPGTQLTLDTKHASGAAGAGAIATGLPRVEELLEARAPKGQAFISPISGIVEIQESETKHTVKILPQSNKTEHIELTGEEKIKVKDGKEVKLGDVLASKADGKNPIVAPFDGVVELGNNMITISASAGSVIKVEIPIGYSITVSAGDEIEAGDRLSEGSLNLHDLMKYKGIEETERYIMNEILSVYASQGHEISSKHLEIIVRQMFSRAIINDPGDSEFIVGSTVSIAAILTENARLEAEGKTPIDFTQQLLGITKVSTWSDSFLSAASFQDTNRILVTSAISGRVDKLRGLKENVIIGRRIPVGTGARGFGGIVEEQEIAEDALIEETKTETE
jgi:DNA-directed RNA polymerase subunit beta'